MTAQVREHLRYKEKGYYLATEPLYPYLKTKGISFVADRTSCWRGYVGDWLIEDNKLYLVELHAYIRNYEQIGLDYLFPGQTKVFADWFSGEIQIPHGKIMRYVHQGYASLYEKELFLKIEKGVVVKEYEIDNTHFYDDKEGMEKQCMNNLLGAVFGFRPQRIKKRNAFQKSFYRFKNWLTKNIIRASIK